MFDSLSNLDASKKKGSTTPVMADSLPGILPTFPKGALNPENYKIRYQKLNMDELADITELERIETRAIRDQGIYVLSKKDFIFMDKVFVLIQYLEADEDAIESAQIKKDRAEKAASKQEVKRDPKPATESPFFGDGPYTKL